MFPSAKHGADAAWLRLQVITHNLLQLLKAVALPKEYADARPKKAASFRIHYNGACGKPRLKDVTAHSRRGDEGAHCSNTKEDSGNDLGHNLTYAGEGKIVSPSMGQ